MNQQCPHAERENIIAAMTQIGWGNTHETKKVLLFEKADATIYFNGQDNKNIDLVFHPILVGANFNLFRDAGAAASDRFMSNYSRLPKKPSPGQPLNHFGVGCKFPDIKSAVQFVKTLHVPVAQ